MARRCRRAERVAATGAVDAVVDDAYGAIFGTELVPAWVMHAVADVPGVEYAAAVAAVVGDDAGRVAVVARWVAFGVVVWVAVVGLFLHSVSYLAWLRWFR